MFSETIEQPGYESRSADRYLPTELATELAAMPGVDALHIFPLGAEAETREVAAAFRGARGVAAQRR